MNSPFELQIYFKNCCNWTYTLFIEIKIIRRHIRLHRRHGKHDKKNLNNLHKNSLFSKRYIYKQ